MKKTLLAIACALFLGQGMTAQNVQDVTYVEDPQQGYLFNRFKDNWFITGEGGANVFFSPGDVNRDWQDRFMPAASLYVGKWFSPILGLRGGASWLAAKGLSSVIAPGVQPDQGTVNGYYKQTFSHVGPVFDAMVNLTNWWRGYHPGRWYNLMVYGGGGAYFTYARDYTSDDHKYRNMHDRVMVFRAGIINSFNVSKQVQISLDIRFSAIDNHRDKAAIEAWNQTSYDAAAFLGVTYLFKDREWHAPVIPLCPEQQNCDEYIAALAAADARIADLEEQLRAALNRPVEVIEEAAPAPLATIYFPINVYRMTREDVNVVNACAEVMLANPDTKYVVTGWADNYTGNNEINVRLRKNRAASVEKQLLKAGVPAGQFETTINNGNLCDMGEKFVALDRATTIAVAR